jgi:hypothetical protein
MQIIEKYFPHLTATQKAQFDQLDALYHDWNAKINVISRKDIDNLYEHHVLHSLAIAMAMRFKDALKSSILVQEVASQAFLWHTLSTMPIQTDRWNRQENTCGQ